MARAGLRALEFYDPRTQKHGQAHMQARYVSILSGTARTIDLTWDANDSLGITQHLINSGIARLEEIRGADGKLENLYVRVGADGILSCLLLLFRPYVMTECDWLKGG